MTAVRRARAAVAAVFFLNGLLFGSWAARIPAIRDRLDLSHGELGIALAFLPVGSIIAMPVAGALAARFGSRRATRLALVVMCAATAVVALAPSLPALAALALARGVGMGSLDVVMNLHGVTVERRYGRPILAGFHAAFSLGGLAGAGLGALAAGAALDARVGPIESISLRRWPSVRRSLKSWNRLPKPSRQRFSFDSPTRSP